MAKTVSKKPRVLVWIMADPKLLMKRVIHQKATWGKRCENLIVFSSQENKTFPTIGLNNTQEGRSHIDHKAKAAWKYIYEHYRNDFDFFVKVDTDTYLVIDNLLEFLADKDPSEPAFYGHMYTGSRWKFWTYPAGGPGEVLTRKALEILVTQAFVKHDDCWPDGDSKYLFVRGLIVRGVNCTLWGCVLGVVVSLNPRLPVTSPLGIKRYN